MKTIEKTTREGDPQRFEIITSRRELRSWLRDAFWDSLYSQHKTGTWEDEDSSVMFYDREGTLHSYFAGDEVKRYNVEKIQKLLSSNSATTVIYGDVPIVYNEDWGGWEAKFD